LYTVLWEEERYLGMVLPTPQFVKTRLSEHNVGQSPREILFRDFIVGTVLFHEDILCETCIQRNKAYVTYFLMIIFETGE
jgi:hypothetical protein